MFADDTPLFSPIDDKYYSHIELNNDFRQIND